MGFFPTVNKGDKVQPTAEFHNAVVRTVNQVLGRNGGAHGGLARTRITIPIEATESIAAGSPVELLEQGDFAWGTRPYLARTARTASSIVGVARTDLNENQIGSVVVYGLADIAIPDNSTGGYVTLKAVNGKMQFTRTGTQTQYFLIDHEDIVVGSKQAGHIIWTPYAYAENTNDFHAELVGWNSETKLYSIKWRGGTAFCYGETPVTIQGDRRNNIGEDEQAYLYYDRSNSPKWEFRLKSEDGNIPSSLLDGEIVIPLWTFTYANDGSGVLSQSFEGGVMVPRLRNALDTETAS
jgi:hypothetical protein